MEGGREREVERERERDGGRDRKGGGERDTHLGSILGTLL